MLVQFSLANSTQLELWVSPASIAEGELNCHQVSCSQKEGWVHPHAWYSTHSADQHLEQ